MHLQLQGELVLSVRGVLLSYCLPQPAGSLLAAGFCRQGIPHAGPQHLSPPAPASPCRNFALRSWEEVVPPFKYDPQQPYFQIQVPTVDTTRFSWLLQAALEVQQPVLLTGRLLCLPTGSLQYSAGCTRAAGASPAHRRTAACDDHRSLGQFAGCFLASCGGQPASHLVCACGELLWHVNCTDIWQNCADAERVAVANHACKISKSFDLPWQVALEWARLPWSRACCASRTQADRQCLSCSITVPKPPALQPSRSLRAAWRSCAKTGASCRAAMFRVANTWQSQQWVSLVLADTGMCKAKPSAVYGQQASDLTIVCYASAVASCT